MSVENIIDQKSANLTTALAQLEQKRQHNAKRCIIHCLIWPTLATILFTPLSDMDIFGLIVVAAIIYPISWCIIYSIYKEDLSAMYKENILDDAVNELGKEESAQQFKYMPKDCDKPSLRISMDNCHLMENKGNELEAEDGIEGKIDKTDFIFTEVSYATSYTDEDGCTHTNNIFKGLVFSADFNKYFNGTTLICHHRPEHLSGDEFKKISLENGLLMKKFNIYSTDEVEARYILSTSLQERITKMVEKLQKQTGESKFAMSFSGDRVLVLVPSHKNHFEAPLFHKLTLKRVKEDLFLMYDMVEIVNDLNLNTRIWTKQ